MPDRSRYAELRKRRRCTDCGGTLVPAAGGRCQPGVRCGYCTLRNRLRDALRRATRDADVDRGIALCLVLELGSYRAAAKHLGVARQGVEQRCWPRRRHRREIQRRYHAGTARLLQIPGHRRVRNRIRNRKRYRSGLCASCPARRVRGRTRCQRCLDRRAGWRARREGPSAQPG